MSPDHTETRPLVGRDLSPLILGQGEPERAGESLYFMTDDDITRGLDQHNFLGWDYNSVIQQRLSALLMRQRRQKRLAPGSAS